MQNSGSSLSRQISSGSHPLPVAPAIPEIMSGLSQLTLAPAAGGIANAQPEENKAPPMAPHYHEDKPPRMLSMSSLIQKPEREIEEVKENPKPAVSEEMQKPKLLFDYSEMVRKPDNNAATDLEKAAICEHDIETPPTNPPAIATTAENLVMKNGQLIDLNKLFVYPPPVVPQPDGAFQPAVEASGKLPPSLGDSYNAIDEKEEAEAEDAECRICSKPIGELDSLCTLSCGHDIHSLCILEYSAFVMYLQK